VREDSASGAHIEGLTEHTVTELEAVWALLNVGLMRRKTGSTAMNETSSRSHSLFMVTVTQEWPDGTRQVGKLHLGDLAGSENVKKSQVEGTGFAEAAGINKSLSALGHCINALTTKNRTHIPYRDSRLTFLLKESLGGNAKTTLIVTCSPHSFNLDETISTLRFAVRAKRIKNTATVNTTRSVASLERLVECLTREVEELRGRLGELPLSPAAAAAAAAAGRSLCSSKERLRQGGGEQGSPRPRGASQPGHRVEEEALFQKVAEAGLRGSRTRGERERAGTPSREGEEPSSPSSLTGKCLACARHRTEVRALHVELAESKRVHSEAIALWGEESLAHAGERKEAERQVRRLRAELDQKKLLLLEAEAKAATASASPPRLAASCVVDAPTSVTGEELLRGMRVVKEGKESSTRPEREMNRLPKETKERDEAVSEKNSPSPSLEGSPWRLKRTKIGAGTSAGIEGFQEFPEPSLEGERRLHAVEMRLALAEEREGVFEDRVGMFKVEMAQERAARQAANRRETAIEQSQIQAKLEVARLREALAESRRQTQAGERAMEAALSAARGHDKTKIKLAEAEARLAEAAAKATLHQACAASVAEKLDTARKAAERREENMADRLRETMATVLESETRQRSLRPSDVVDTNGVLQMGDRLAYLSKLGKMAEKEGRGEDVAKAVAKVQLVTKKIVQRNLDHHHEVFMSPFAKGDPGIDRHTPPNSGPAAE